MSKKLILGFLLSLIIGAVIGYASSYGKVSMLQSKIERLTSENSQLQTQITSLKNQVDKLKMIRDDLNSSYKKLTKAYQILNLNYTQLLQKHNQLTKAYQVLNSSYSRLLKTYQILNSSYAQLLQDYNQLNSSYQLLISDYNELNQMYQALKEAGLTFDGLNITDLEIIEEKYWGDSVIGNVTNISNKSMPTVYVILFTYDADGTLDDYYVETIKNLAVSETNSFEFSYVLEENQTFRVIAIGNYGLTDIEAGEVVSLLAEIEELKDEIKELKEKLKLEVYVLTDREYYNSIIEDIRSANESILVAMFSMIYDPDDPFDWANDVIRELVYARERGVNVTVILEYRTYWGYMDENLEAYNYLSTHNVTVLLDNESDTDHMKLVIIDHKIVYIGSHNWSESALYYNHETSVKIVSEEIAEELEEYFNHLMLLIYMSFSD